MLSGFCLESSVSLQVLYMFGGARIPCTSIIVYILLDTIVCCSVFSVQDILRLILSLYDLSYCPVPVLTLKDSQKNL
jgi:hypothetical protein